MPRSKQGGLEDIRSELRIVVSELRKLDHRLLLDGFRFPSDGHLRSQLQGGIDVVRRDLGDAIETLDGLLMLDKTEARRRHERAMELYARARALDVEFERLLGNRAWNRQLDERDRRASSQEVAQ